MLYMTSSYIFLQNFLQNFLHLLTELLTSSYIFLLYKEKVSPWRCGEIVQRRPSWQPTTPNAMRCAAHGRCDEDRPQPQVSNASVSNVELWPLECKKVHEKMRRDILWVSHILSIFLLPFLPSCLLPFFVACWLWKRMKEVTQEASARGKWMEAACQVEAPTNVMSPPLSPKSPKVKGSARLRTSAVHGSFFQRGESLGKSKFIAFWFQNKKFEELKWKKLKI